MENILLIVLIALSAISVILSLIVLFKKGKTSSNSDTEYLVKVINKNLDTTTTNLKNTELGIQNILNNISILQRNEADITQKKVDELTQKNIEIIEKLIRDINVSMRQIREENEKQLNQMRETVDEKLNTSLSNRLNDSFSKIKASLDSVEGGLGEMRALASGVGDLKRMLSNVKARGVWGEVTLSNLLEQALTKEQYSTNVAIRPNSNERVDFAVVLPGKDDKNILLPIDSKFPIEDYYRLVDATELAQIDDAEKAKKALFKRIKDEAKKIKEKYIFVPYTTDFAVMFLPLEGLYAEVVRNNELMEILQNDYKVLVCGPTTLMALLNSLQMGFKTMYIEKRSSEIWSMLNIFKQEFEKFVLLLGKTQKKLEEATDNIELATKSSKKISKQLGTVASITETKTETLPQNLDFDVDTDISADQ